MIFAPLKRLLAASGARLPRTLLPALAVAMLWGCMAGGTGTDTENGAVPPKTDAPNIRGVTARVVDAAGAALPGITIHLYLPGYRPDSGLAAATLVGNAAAMVSDSAGFVAVHLKAAGKFVVEGLAGAQPVFFDTLAVPDTAAATLFTFRTRTLRDFRGKVALASGMRIDSGAVFLRGTGRWARLDAAGGYDLGALPEDVGRMGLGLRFGSSPTSVRQVTEHTAPDSGVSAPAGTATFVCKDVPKDSAARIAATPASAPAAAIPKSGLDSSKLNSALNACDSLPKGGVINVVPASGPAKSEAPVPLLVVQAAVPVQAVTGTHLTPAVVVPYADCVPSAAAERTSFAVQVLMLGGASDLLVRDLPERCLAP